MMGGIPRVGDDSWRGRSKGNEETCYLKQEHRRREQEDTKRSTS